MRDHEKASWNDFNQIRQANLQQQLLRTRDSINMAKLNMPGSDDLTMLQAREKTLLAKLAEIKLERAAPVAVLDPDYAFVGVVSEIVCDVCRSVIPIGSPRYHCTEIENYDICQKCFPKTNHKHQTYIEKFDNPSHQKRISKTTSLAEAVSVAFKCYLERPFIGVKKEEGFEWMPYKEVYHKAASIGSALHNKFGLHPREKVAIHSRNSVEWICTDLGSLMNGLVVVPIHHVERDKGALSYIINNCSIKCIFCEAESADLFRELQATFSPQLEHIVIYTPGQSTPAIQDWTGLTRFIDLEAAGHSSEYSIYPLSADDVASIIHTSGSTGRPKGAPFTDKMCREGIFTGFALLDPHVSACFEPLAHISEREYLHAVLSSGGRVGLIDISDNLFDDIGTVGPCSMSSTPRFWNVLHSKYQQALLVEQAISKKNAEEIKKEMLLKFKKLLGSRLKTIGCGGAAPSQELMQFLQECFAEVAVSNGYGSTEAGSIAGGRGYLLNGVQIKLVDIPELGYLTTDTPYPRGELYVKTRTLIPGYYNNEEDTARLFVDGWFCTGDIVERLEERRIQIIDRRKNFFKLSQGEYVAAEKLENRYLASPYVDQIFITCGDIGKYEQTSVFAVIVPHLNLVQKWASDNGVDPKNVSEMCSNPRIIAMIVESLKRVGQTANLAPYEIPNNILLEPEMFTVENGKMTSSNKLARPILERFYKDAVNKKLQELSSKNENTLWMILSDIFGDTLAAGNIGEVSAKTKSLSEIGGDSLSAVRLSSVLSSTLNLDIPPHVLLDKSTTIETIADFITSRKNSPASSLALSLPLNQTLFNEISKDLGLIADMKTTARVDVREVKGVLVTGATGFIGAHLVQHLLLTTPYQITCLVRRKTSESGEAMDPLARLTQALKDFQIWETLGDKVEKLKAVTGDLAAEPKFQIENAEYTNLLSTIDVVFHSGAVVNHALPYSAMRQENVIGTKQVIEFCANNSRKPRLNFVSTISCIPGIAESSPKQAILKYVTSEMGGYEQSKWVAERLVEEAIERRLVVVGSSVMRLGMVGWHNVSGVGNPNDWLFYLFSGIMQLGKFPDSSVAFEMLPVNVVSKILTQLGFESLLKSTIDVCGSKLVPFQDLVKHLGDVEKVAFQKWTADLFDQIGKSDFQTRKHLEGLLLFSSGLPDERKFKKEIEERSAFVVSRFEEASKTYTESEIERYFKFISEFNKK